MTAEHSAGTIVFRKVRGKIFYLLLEYRPDYWGYSKGNIEKGELEKTTFASDKKILQQANNFLVTQP